MDEKTPKIYVKTQNVYFLESGKTFQHVTNATQELARKRLKDLIPPRVWDEGFFDFLWEHRGKIVQILTEAPELTVVPSVCALCNEKSEDVQYALDPTEEESTKKWLCPECRGGKPCEECGSTEEVTFTEDPYKAEIEGDHEKHWLCSLCLANSSNGI